MMRVVLVDDERCVLEELAYLLEGQVDIIGKFNNSLIAVENIAALAPDAVFLDIEMPGLNGLAAAAEILALVPETAIVFITAYDHYAVDAFNLEAIDYLVKPVQPERLSETLIRIQRRLANNQQSASVEKLKSMLENSWKVGSPKNISLWSGRRLFMVPVDQIACCFVTKGERAVKVVAAGKLYRTVNSLADFVRQVGGERLIRCHRSYYLNPKLLTGLELENNNTMTAYVRDYAEGIPVSRSYRKDLYKYRC
jgi:two-component system response regulator LytT